nr:hypothetical protein [Tessaracoccus coleopterorum]
MPFALDRKAVIAAGRRDDDTLRVVSLELDEDVELPLSGLAPGSRAGRPTWRASHGRCARPATGSAVRRWC